MDNNKLPSSPVSQAPPPIPPSPSAFLFEMRRNVQNTHPIGNDNHQIDENQTRASTQQNKGIEQSAAKPQNTVWRPKTEESRSTFVMARKRKAEEISGASEPSTMPHVQCKGWEAWPIHPDIVDKVIPWVVTQSLPRAPSFHEPPVPTQGDVSPPHLQTRDSILHPQPPTLRSVLESHLQAQDGRFFPPQDDKPLSRLCEVQLNAVNSLIEFSNEKDRLEDKVDASYVELWTSKLRINEDERRDLLEVATWERDRRDALQPVLLNLAEKMIEVSSTLDAIIEGKFNPSNQQKNGFDKGSITSAAKRRKIKIKLEERE